LFETAMRGGERLVAVVRARLGVELAVLVWERV
jgi:hypothetical protein